MYKLIYYYIYEYSYIYVLIYPLQGSDKAICLQIFKLKSMPKGIRVKHSYIGLASKVSSVYSFLYFTGYTGSSA